LNTDPRDWLETKNITENLTLPTDIVPGSYKLYLHLPDIYETIANRPEYAIRFANNNMWDSTTGYNDLNHTVVINQPLSLVDNERTKMILYPIPASNELFVENDEIEEFKFVIYNSIGQEILINSTQIGNKISFDIQSLSNGIYFLQFENGLTKDSRRFIVKH
jgi:hypothetical protein